MRTPKWLTAGELLCFAPYYLCLGLRDMLGEAVLDDWVPRGGLDFVGFATTGVGFLVHWRWCRRPNGSDPQPKRVELNPLSRAGAVWIACAAAACVVDLKFGESLASLGCPPGVLLYVFYAVAFTFLIFRVMRTPRDTDTESLRAKAPAPRLRGGED